MPSKSKHIKLSLKDQKLLEKASQIISDHLSDESFGIEELRRGIGLSRSQLHRRLHNITGLSTSHFIRSVRLKKAFELLKEGNLSVSEVAYNTGFSSPSYFNKCFHEQYGFPPGDIHKQKIAEIDPRNIFNPMEPFASDLSQKVGFRMGKLYFYGIVIFVLVIIALIYYLQIGPFNNPQIHDKSIAVLPFKNLSNNQENQYLSDGMMEAILSNISKIGNLRVISRTSVEQYRESSKSAKQIGSELGVNHVLEGSTFQDDHNIRITVQLINTKTDEHIWSESYDSKLIDIFEVQSQIAKRIANILQAKITASEMLRIEQILTANSKAYDLYQQAQFHYIKFLQRRQELDYVKCKSLFSLAILEDTTFAAAYTSLADLYWIKNYRYEYYSETFMDTVFLLCQKALIFDPQSSNAHRLLGQYYFETGNREIGITELETAISINGNNALAYETLGFYYNWIGKWETGIPYIFKSIQLDPYSIFLPFRYVYLARAYLDLLDFNNTFFYSKRAIELGDGEKWVLGYAYWINAHSNLILGNSKEALIAVEKLEEYNENSALRDKAEIYCNLMHDCEKGLDIYETLFKRDPSYFNTRHRYAYALWENGKYDSAKLMFDVQIKAYEKELELGRIERNDPYYNLAGIYTFLKEYDKAFEHLKKHQFTSGMEIYAEKDPLFKNLKNNQEFKMIIQKAKDEKQLLKNKIDRKVSEKFGL